MLKDKLCTTLTTNFTTKLAIAGLITISVLNIRQNCPCLEHAHIMLYQMEAIIYAAKHAKRAKKHNYTVAEAQNLVKVILVGHPKPKHISIF